MARLIFDNGYLEDSAYRISKQTGDEEGVPGACVRLTVGTVATAALAGKSIHQRMPLGRIHRPNPEIIDVLATKSPFL